MRRVVIDGADALLWMVNQAALTYHGFASRLGALVEPDWTMIDLDPGEATTWADIGWDEVTPALDPRALGLRAMRRGA